MGTPLISSRSLPRAVTTTWCKLSGALWVHRSLHGKGPDKYLYGDIGLTAVSRRLGQTMPQWVETEEDLYPTEGVRSHRFERPRSSAESSARGALVAKRGTYGYREGGIKCGRGGRLDTRSRMSSPEGLVD